MPHTFSKSAFYSFGDIPLANPLPLIFSHARGIEGGLFIFIVRKLLLKQPQRLFSDVCPIMDSIPGDLLNSLVSPLDRRWNIFPQSRHP